jgi:hypothetical protein
MSAKFFYLAGTRFEGLNLYPYARYVPRRNDSDNILGICLFFEKKTLILYLLCFLDFSRFVKYRHHKALSK